MLRWFDAIKVCEKFEKQYYGHDLNANYPGGKDEKVLVCPHCQYQKEGLWMTSGFFKTQGIESVKLLSFILSV